MVIWIIGLSGSGKTTIANLLFKKLKKKYSNIVHLDGDVVRQIYDDKIGYSIDDRKIITSGSNYTTSLKVDKLFTQD